MFTSDLENSLITDQNKVVVGKLLTQIATNGVDYTVGYDLNSLRRQIGSKGIPLNPLNQPLYKKPYIHRKIADTIDLDHSHPDVGRLLEAIDAL